MEMPRAASDLVKRKAASIVLATLGEGTRQLVEQHLSRYGVSLDVKESSKFSLDQLHFGLSVLLGEGMANMLLQQIIIQIDEIQRDHDVATDTA
jgi:hypothetical protein